MLLRDPSEAVGLDGRGWSSPSLDEALEGGDVDVDGTGLVSAIA